MHLLSVRAERYQVLEGKTPEITVKQARKLLASIDLSTVVGLRDRAAISVLIYTAARVGAVAVGLYYLFCLTPLCPANASGRDVGLSLSR